MKVLFTGFEPFGPHVFNPSSVAAEEAARVANAAFRVLPVSFESARAAGESSVDYDLVIHLGLAAATGWVRLERFAHNVRMHCDDPEHETDPDAVIRLESSGPAALETTFPVSALRRALNSEWDVRHCRDAGTYVCNATYYWSLRCARSAKVAFIHVPLFKREQAERFGRSLGAAVAALRA